MKQVHLTKMSAKGTLALHSKMQEHLLQFHYAVRGFQSEAAGFRKSSTNSKLSISNPHNSEIIPEYFYTIQLPFLPLLHYLVKTQTSSTYRTVAITSLLLQQPPTLSSLQLKLKQLYCYSLFLPPAMAEDDTSNSHFSPPHIVPKTAALLSPGNNGKTQMATSLRLDALAIRTREQKGCCVLWIRGK